MIREFPPLPFQNDFLNITRPWPGALRTPLALRAYIPTVIEVQDPEAASRRSTAVCDFKRLTAPGPHAQIRPMTKPQSIVPIERIASRIYLIRSEKVMLDSDLAELYGVSTSALNQ